MSTLFGKKKSTFKRKRELNNNKSDNVLNDNDDIVTIPKSSNDDSDDINNNNEDVSSSVNLYIQSFNELGLWDPLVTTCKQLGFRRPTPVQRTVIPFLVNNRKEHVLALAATGTGKTAAYVLPIIHHLSVDPYGIYAVVLTPTRELAKQIHQQVIALGSAYNVKSVLVVGGLDSVQQSCQLQSHPHICVATPGRLASLLRGPKPPRLTLARYLVLDEADRLLAANSGFEKDVAELLLHCRRDKRQTCQTLLFSATITASLQSIEELAAAGGGDDGDRMPLRKFIIRQDGEESSSKPKKKVKSGCKKEDAECEAETCAENNVDDDDSDDTESGADDSDDTESGADDEFHVGPKIPEGLHQEYIFMPTKVRDAYLLATVRTLLAYGGRLQKDDDKNSKKKHKKRKAKEASTMDDDLEALKAKSAIIFVSTCERAALVSGILEQVGVANVALHSLLSQHRRLAALGKFQSEQVRVLVATDVAARGLDIPHADLVINSELPRNPVNYIHRVGRTARAGRRGRAVSLVSEADVTLVHAAEKASGRELVKCTEITDDIAVSMLGPATKAARLTKLKLVDIGFDELVQKFKERKVRDRKERMKIGKALKKQMKNSQTTK